MVNSDFKTTLHKFSEAYAPYEAKLLADFATYANHDETTRAINIFQPLAVKGKKLRGFLVKIGFDIFSQETNDEIYFASALFEVLQTGVLIQDDVTDQSDTRRGYTSFHKQYEQYLQSTSNLLNKSFASENVATYIGDCSYFFAAKTLLGLNFPAENVIKAGSSFFGMLTTLGFGQILDVLSFGPETNEEKIKEILWLKSGMYSIYAPLEFGAMLAGGYSQEMQSHVREFSKHLGWVFQIQDDILGSFGDAGVMGKPTDIDIKEGKNTLLVLYAQKNISNESKSKLTAILGKIDATPEEIEEVREIFVQTGALEKLKLEAQMHAQEAIKSLEKICNVQSESYRLLSSLLDFMLSRTF